MDSHRGSRSSIAVKESTATLQAGSPEVREPAADFYPPRPTSALYCESSESSNAAHTARGSTKPAHHEKPDGDGDGGPTESVGYHAGLIAAPPGWPAESKSPSS